jgi:RNA polymerase sigma-70 factor (ECF subfamily)
MTTVSISRVNTMYHADLTAAVQQVFERCGQAFCRYFTVRTGGRSDVVDDLMQQLWLRSRLAAADLQDPNAEPWLWRIAQNLLHEHRRKRGRAPLGWVVAQPELARTLARQFDREDLPAEVLARGEVQDQLLLALTELSSDEQELLVGFYFENCSHATLAERLGISPRAVEGRLYRARQALRDKLADLEP